MDCRLGDLDFKDCAYLNPREGEEGKALAQARVDRLEQLIGSLDGTEAKIRAASLDEAAYKASLLQLVSGDPAAHFDLPSGWVASVPSSRADARTL